MKSISGFTSTGFTIFENIKHVDESLNIMEIFNSQWIRWVFIFLFSIIFLIDIYDESFKKSLTNFISFNSSEILKQATKNFSFYIQWINLLIFYNFEYFSNKSF